MYKPIDYFDKMGALDKEILEEFYPQTRDSTEIKALSSPLTGVSIQS